MNIDIDDLRIEITKKPIKNINLRIYPPDGQVKITAPLQCKTHQITDFVKEKKEWIIKQQQKLQTQPRIEEQRLQTGSILPYKGAFYELEIIEQYGPSHVLLQEERIRCYTSHAPSSSVLTQALDHWYKKEMSHVVPKLLAYWEPIIGVQVLHWSIRKMKTRWGSCNTRARRICLNLSLIKKPLVCLEYVLVHELIHILEPSHNKRFYQLMSNFLPDWQQHNELLERNIIKYKA